MEEIEIRKTILSILDGASSKDDDVCRLKKLRKMVLLTLQMDESEKSSKKKFKKIVKELEEEDTISLNGDGVIRLKKRKALDELSPSKRKKSKSSGEKDTEKKSITGNPQGITRLFLGNLPFAVDEDALQSFLPGTVTHVKWITDKETGKFYGSAFIEIDSAENAASAVELSGSQLMGRPIKINLAPARPGEVWPPAKKVISGGQAGGSGVKAMSEKPENCVKLFMGNCSYDIDDDTITKLFEEVESDVKAIRWLHHKHNGDFKGCGYVEFFNAEACSRAATLNGKKVLGRPIRLDWAE